MTGLIATVLDLDPQTPMFRRGAAWIRAGQVRATAARAMQKMEMQADDIFLHTRSAACFVAGIVAATALGRRILLPAHAQNAYLAEIGCAQANMSDDAALALRSEGDSPAGVFAGMAHDGTLGFFTSGTMGAPKRVETRLSGLEKQARTLDQLWGARLGHVRGTVSHQHIYGLLFRVLWPILARRTADDEMTLCWEECLGTPGPTCTLISSPAHLTRLPPGDGPFANPPLEVFSSGQALPYEAALACARVFGSAPIEVLGSTETGGIAWRRQTSPAMPWTSLPDVMVSAASDGALEMQSPGNLDAGPIRTGDGIEMLADGRFHLRPRGDRIEKIDGKRVSLARVESVLGALQAIEAVAALTLPARKHGLAAIVTLTQQGQAQLKELGAFQLSRVLRAACADQLEPAERPKHWRFLDAIPTDAQGKRVLSLLRAVFDQADPLAPLQPEITHCSAHEAEIAIWLDPDLRFFEGHFPDRPILPGIAQVHIAALLARRLWHIELPGADLARVKFRHILQPNDRARLVLSCDEARQCVRFSYYIGPIEASVGEIGSFS